MVAMLRGQFLRLLGGAAIELGKGVEVALLFDVERVSGASVWWPVRPEGMAGRWRPALLRSGGDWCAAWWGSRSQRGLSAPWASVPL